MTIMFNNETQLSSFIPLLGLKKDQFAVFGGNRLSISSDLTLARSLTSWIREHYEEKLLRSICRKNFIIGEEWLTLEKILHKSVDLAQISQAADSTLFDEILQLLEKEPFLSISGIVDFRLRAYKNILYEIIEKGIGILSLEREKWEFIELLQYFLALQDSLCRLVHVLYKDEQYILVDENYNEIKCFVPTELSRPFDANEITQEDQLLSSLISIAPERIMIHNDENKMPTEFSEILRCVFDWRIAYCNGCGLCKNYSCQI